MTTTLSPTHFAPAERAAPVELEREISLFQDSLALTLLDCLPICVIILNRHRQIVFGNEVIRGIAPEKNILGMRPGEALDCIHACEEEGGCGTTIFCRYCGAVRAILKSLQGRVSTEECVIRRRPGAMEETLNLQVFSSPFRYDEKEFVLFSVLDISHEKQVKHMEQIFLHDLTNIITGLHYSVQAIKGKVRESLFRRVIPIERSTRRLIEEIDSHRSIFLAEQGTLSMNPQPVNSLRILEETRALFQGHLEAQEKHIGVDPGSQSHDIDTDPVLLKRVLGNMVKNALEASALGETVTLGTLPVDQDVTFTVHNMAVMPEPVQLQVFNRTFSTKGKGRGFGTYGMQLLTERYLGGTISFISKPGLGTVFSLRLPRNPA